ncbi:MAG: precorrin-8X methylmutase [Desulfobacterales bacterium]
MKPASIEEKSFAIIDAEAGDHDFPPDQWAIVRRMIHTSADFDYMRTIRFHPLAVTAGIDAIRKGKAITTDTQMARSGIRSAEVRRFGCRLECMITEPTVVRAAAEAGTTRAAAAVDASLPVVDGGIYVVGNAPTALLRLIELVRAGKADPALIVGLPVGFVNAAESKAELATLDRPFITNEGRKGGSNVAAAVVNALLIMAREGDLTPSE